MTAKIHRADCTKAQPPPVDGEIEKSLRSQSLLVAQAVHNGFLGTSLGFERRSEVWEGLQGGMQAAEAPLEGFLCPITYEIMTDPVLTPYGHSYERRAIEQAIGNQRVGCDPLTRKPLRKDQLIANRSLKTSVDAWKVQHNLTEKKVQDALKQAQEAKKALAEQLKKNAKLESVTHFYEEAFLQPPSQMGMPAQLSASIAASHPQSASGSSASVLSLAAPARVASSQIAEGPSEIRPLASASSPAGSPQSASGSSAAAPASAASSQTVRGERGYEKFTKEELKEMFIQAAKDRNPDIIRHIKEDSRFRTINFTLEEYFKLLDLGVSLSPVE